MDQLTQAQVLNLLDQEAQPSVSIFIPTQKKSPESHQNPIRFGNAIKKARTDLQKADLVNHQIKEQITLAEKLFDNDDFWMHQGHGLAIFISQDAIHHYRLSIPVPEQVFVTTHFVVRPLLPLLTTNGKYFILTLSQNNIKLYEATRDSIDKRFLEEIPTSMEEAIEHEDLQKYLHMSSKSKSSHAGVSHGQGPGDENIKKDIAEFLNLVENGITQMLQGEYAPLVICGVEYLASMYRKINKYKYLVDQTIEGNLENESKQSIHQKSWEIVRDEFKRAEQEALDKYAELAGTGKTSANIEKIVTAAHNGQVETLFILRDHIEWGQYNLAKRQATKHQDNQKGDRDLLDLAAFYTLKASGMVYSLKPGEMIKNKTATAVLRY